MKTDLIEENDCNSIVKKKKKNNKGMEIIEWRDVKLILIIINNNVIKVIEKKEIKKIGEKCAIKETKIVLF